MSPDPTRMQRLIAAAQRLLCLPGRIAAWLILLLVFSTVVAVITAAVGGATLLDWEGDLPILGPALTVNSLMDMQWFIFALIVLFGGIWSFTDERHVTVDTVAQRFSPRTRAWISILGDAFLLMPFCLVSIWYGWKFAAVSYATSEASTVGGLSGYWLIKGAVPVAFTLLALSAIVHILKIAGELRSGKFHKVVEHHDS